MDGVNVRDENLFSGLKCFFGDVKITRLRIF